MTSMRIRCADKYEAQKLASMIFIKKSRQTYITAILNIIDNEIVVTLQDKSAHSLMLYDRSQAEALAGYLQDVMEGYARVTDVDVRYDVVYMTKSAHHTS